MPDDVRPADPELRHNMLGMTETGSVCLMSPDESDQPERYRGSFGRPVPELEARVVDPDTLADCAPGEQGELWFRGPLLMEGYYGRERHEMFTADGWFRTGDLFPVDDDGFFYFHGRRGDMIKTAGANVSPREVEARHPRRHRRAARDRGRGRRSRARADRRRGHRRRARRRSSTSTVSRPCSRPGCRRTRCRARSVRLAPDEVPMLSSGKLDMARLREMIRGR